jgi:anti-sigma regulatory factor (Ser/Thr protein kinase)/predicted transcriptional regulator
MRFWAMVNGSYSLVFPIALCYSLCYTAYSFDMAILYLIIVEIKAGVDEVSFNIEERQQLISKIIEAIGASEQFRGFKPHEFAKKHNMSVQTVYRYLKQFENEKRITIRRNGRRNEYKLLDEEISFRFELSDITEDGVWRNHIHPILKDMPEIAYKNCNYAFTEMLCNAIDHSGGTHVDVSVRINSYSTTILIHDNGVGIFTKIAEAMNFAEKRFAVLELAKGKFTTDPESHSGEGIFFSSKATFIFTIYSDDLMFQSLNSPDSEADSMLMDHSRSNYHREPTILDDGTTVMFIILHSHQQTLKELFDKYTNAPEDYGFTKTVVPVKMLEYGDAAALFTSRSQAKRLLARFERFEHIELDFTDIQDIGQGFADEIFRVFEIQHPNITLTATHCNEQVQYMINRAKKS